MRHIAGLAAATLIACLALPAAAQDPAPQQSTTGPIPPANVTAPPKVQTYSATAATNTINSVPIYYWRHGCGPTAVGMVVGYYDTHAFSDLYTGDGSTQTADVDQGIASQGSGLRGSGLQLHYEDYACPRDDNASQPLTDSSATYPTGCHLDDCIADFMHTSWSKDGNFYGWSWSNMISPAFTSYVRLRNSQYAPTCTQYYGSGMSWSVLTTEIDNGRPMVFLVDSTGDGKTDHFVTVVGYNDTPTQQYGCRDTWYAPIRWCQLRGLSNTYTWGVWGGWSLKLPPLKALSPVPASGVTGKRVNTTLSWTAGPGATAYDVYFGTNPTPGTSELKGTQTTTTYTPGPLAYNQTYYWRIDSQSAGHLTTTGTVWSFTTSTPKADINNDGDVDADDFTRLAQCTNSSGPNQPPTLPGCVDSDLDGDNDVDQSDFGMLQKCFSGAGVTAAPNCAAG